MSYLSRLRGRSSDELLVRGTQELTALLERYRVLPEAREISDAALARRLTSGAATAASLLEHFRARSGREFFPAFANAPATVAVLRRCWPSAEREVVARADRAAEGRFDLLGYRALSFGDPIDWHLDPLAGRRAPRRPWSRIPYLRPDVVGDHKIIWELNRHQHFALLGQAYWLTGDERYAAAFVRQLTGWMDANPPKVGINWASNLEVAFRSISWLWGLYYFRSSAALTPAVFSRALKFLYLHGRHLESYLSTYFSPNTHLTGEALGLFYLGTLLPELRRAKRWQEMGWRILLDELRRQVREDGVYFEQSTWYHKYTTDFYLHALLLARANEWPVDVELPRTVQALLDHMMFMTRPDGRTPLIGDDDGGHLVRLDAAAPSDFRGTLALGAMVFGRADYAAVAQAPAPQALWVMGAIGLDAFQRAGTRYPARASAAYPASGVYVMRDEWGDEGNHLVIDSGPHGALTAGHAHADALAIELSAYGRAILVDPGTYTYVGDARNAFRSSLAHNTLAIDGASSSMPGKTFKWRETATSSARAWVSQPRFDYFEGEHDGYRRLASPALHRRSVLFLKQRYWIVVDRVESAAPHRVDVRMQCSPGVSVAQAHAGMLTLGREDAAGGAGLRVCTFGAHGALEVEEGRVSPVFGAAEEAPLCRYVGTSHGIEEIISVLLPWRGRAPEAHVAETVVDGGRSIVIAQDHAVDVLLLREGDRVRAAGMETDARLAWFSREASASKVVEFVLIDGSLLRVDGHEIIRRTGRGGWIAGRREGGMWSISTGALLDAPERD